MRMRAFTLRELSVLMEALTEHTDNAADGDDEISRELNKDMPLAERLLEEIELAYIRRAGG